MPQGMEIRNKVEVVHLIIISDINSLILFKLSYIVLVMTEMTQTRNAVAVKN